MHILKHKHHSIIKHSIICPAYFFISFKFKTSHIKRWKQHLAELQSRAEQLGVLFRR